jgi:hypothetical protein
MGYGVLDFRRRRASGFGGAFSAFGLFSGGGLGLLYNSSDMSTLFQDSLGTTPVTTAGQSNGLTLDKSQGLVLGPELVTNGDFAIVSDWSLGSGWAISGGSGNHTSGGGTGDLRQSITMENGKSYKIPWSLIATSGSALGAARINSVVLDSNMGTVGNYQAIYLKTASESGDLIFAANNLTECKLDDVSVREIPGNHATQSSGSFKSKYQAGPDRKVFDGIDDRDNTILKPTASGTLAVRMRSNTASKVAIGSQPASDGRCYIGLASDGSLAGGIGTQATSVIKGSADVRTDWVTGVLTWDGSTVTLYQDGTSVYSAAQSGAVSTTIDLTVGALNNNSTAIAFLDGDIARALVIDRAITSAEVTDLSTLWGNIS